MYFDSSCVLKAFTGYSGCKYLHVMTMIKFTAVKVVNRCKNCKRSKGFILSILRLLCFKGFYRFLWL
jgi:hypothetical protein